MKYLIKDTENNKLYRPNLINTIVEAETIGEYIKTNNNDMFLLTEVEPATMEIETHNNIKEVEKLTNTTYSFQTPDIDSIVYVNEHNTAIKVIGKGSKKYNKLIKSLVEKYINNEITLNNYKSAAYKEINKINKLNYTVEKASIIKDNKDYLLFLSINQDNKRIGYIEYNVINMEIINHSRIREGSDRSAALKDLINYLSLQPIKK